MMPENGEVQPVSLRDDNPQPPTPARDARSRVLLYGFGVMVAAVFLVACLITTPLGNFGAGNDEDSLNEDEVRAIVAEVVGTEIASASVGGGASSAQVQQMIDAAVGTEVAAFIPTTTPIPPTPTVIPVGVAEDDDAFEGPEDAPVVIVEFGDFQCGFCGRWYKETLPQILANYPTQVKYVYRDFVIFGEESMRAAMATECAREQDKYWEMHYRLYDRLENQEDTPLVQETFVSYAADLGMDTDAFSECLSSNRYQDEVTKDFQAAQAYGLRGTPGFVINGVVYPIGAQPFEVFAGIIDGELTRLAAEGS